jgi:endonuclease/exonuclease/phosphatase family metal-dependent hydrolase
MITPVTVRSRVRRRTGAVVLGIVAALVVSGGGAGSGTAAVADDPRVAPRGPLVARAVAPGAVRSARVWWSSPSRGISYTARCGTPVVASHPGTAVVRRRAVWGERVQVEIVASNADLRTVHTFVRDPQVGTGYLVQAGQVLGYVPWAPAGGRCVTNWKVRDNGAFRHPTWWLNRYVSEVAPTSRLLNVRGFTLATFNVLGASHTDPGGSRGAWPGYRVRLPKAIAMLERYGADVVGLQEFQRRQRELFLELAGREWGIYPSSATADPENSIIWRTDRFELRRAGTFPVPYFNGHIRQMPYVFLRDKLTGRTAWFVNVHNPADTSRYPNQGRWRAEAIRRERQLVINLRADGRPVYLTGDFNARWEAFCPLTAKKLMISPESIPSMTCKMPKYSWVDWIFAAGQTRFNELRVDTSPRGQRISDHPLIVGEAHNAL